jgi:hypothetical protein
VLAVGRLVDGVAGAVLVAGEQDVDRPVRVERGRHAPARVVDVVRERTVDPGFSDDVDGLGLVPSTNVRAFAQLCADAELPLTDIGTVGGERLTIRGLVDLPLEVVTAAFVAGLPDALGEATA